MGIMKKILVPTDFSEVAKNAENYALAFARNTTMEILLFHAGMGEGARELNAIRTESSHASASALNVKARIISDKKFTPEAIREAVNENEIDLVIMGTVGEEADIMKTIVGSNAVMMIDNAAVPVLLVPPGVAYTGYTKIAYASELWNIDEEIPKVIEFAKIFSSAIEIFHVNPVFPDLGDVEKIDMKQKLAEIKQKFGYSAIDYSEERTGHDNQVKKGIELFMSHSQVDLLVMFHNKRSGFDKLFTGSNTANSATHLVKPLLVFPK
jgi:nucleotide-binding universal stress UspA family protein